MYKSGNLYGRGKIISTVEVKALNKQAYICDINSSLNSA